MFVPKFEFACPLGEYQSNNNTNDTYIFYTTTTLSCGLMCHLFDNS